MWIAFEFPTVFPNSSLHNTYYRNWRIGCTLWAILTPDEPPLVPQTVGVSPIPKEPPLARAIWKGNISFGLVSIPVGLFSAETRDEISFRQLDRKNLSPIGYRKYNKATGQEVESDD